jgi:hypothetical protein
MVSRVQLSVSTTGKALAVLNLLVALAAKMVEQPVQELLETEEMEFHLYTTTVQVVEVAVTSVVEALA